VDASPPQEARIIAVNRSVRRKGASLLIIVLIFADHRPLDISLHSAWYSHPTEGLSAFYPDIGLGRGRKKGVDFLKQLQTLGMKLPVPPFPQRRPDADDQMRVGIGRQDQGLSGEIPRPL
jgi:hypothetical protein